MTVARFRAAPAILFVLSLALASLGAGRAAAHPHMFFDAQAGFVFDEQGRLAALRVAFVVDELNTLYTLQALEIDPADGMSEAETAKLVGGMLRGLGEFGYFTDLQDGGEPVALGAPRDPGATVQDGLIGMRFVLPLETPLDPKGRTVLLRLYDPTYYVEVTMAAGPESYGDKPAGCETGFSKFDPAAEVIALQRILAELSAEETPEQENIGAIFSDRATLACTS